MIACYCDAADADVCSGGGVTPHGCTCGCRCHRADAHGALLADVSRELRAAGRMTATLEHVVGVAWLRALAGTDIEGRA